MAQVRKNNTKEWFEAHKHEYEKEILEPGREFVIEMGEHLQALVPTINAIPKINGSLFRIYRDSRFHRVDPIKTHIGFVFWHGWGKRMQSSYFYMHFDADSLLFASGMRRFKPEMLATYRDYIKDDKNREALHNILEALKAKGYQLPEQRYVRYPRGFNAEMPHAYLSLFNCMYAFTTQKAEKEFFTEALPAKAYDIYEDMFDLQQWVYEMTLTVE
jgi:uncharacterized protein (TIGR02453 family)